MQPINSGHSRQIVIVVCAVLLLVLAVVATATLTLFDSTNTEAATDGAAMSLRVDAAQTIGCAGGPPGKVCMNVNQKFDVMVVADGIPLTSGYILTQVWVDYDNQGLVHKPASDFNDPFCATGTRNPCANWPDLSGPTFLTTHDVANHGMTAGGLTAQVAPKPPSFHKGDLFSFSLTCTATQSASQLTIIPSGVAPANNSGSLFAGAAGTAIPAVTGLTVNCVAPTPTPTGTATPTITLTPTPTDTATPSPDTDGDGCTDLQEMGPQARIGGQRDYLNPHDFYDAAGSPLPPQNGAPDGMIDLPNDILGVIQHHPAGDLGYDIQFDRGSWTGPNSWNDTQGPDGAIDLPNDILGVILQFGHRCVP